MSTRLKEKEEQIQQVLGRLIEENMSGKPIIVEGRKDVEALRKLGVEGKIFSAKTGGKSFLDIISEIEEENASEVILMLDFDRRGRELTENLKSHFEKTGVAVNLSFWLKLYSLVGREVKDVEGLAKYMETLQSKIKNS
ncbi:MAG: toprim domain-containing protein [Candidatus Bathyarchaeia archaeon]